MRRRIEYEIGNVCDWRRPSRHCNKQAATGLDTICHVTSKVKRVRDVFNDMECTDRIIFESMRCAMLRCRFVPDIESGVCCGEIGIEPNVGRMREVLRQSALAAPDVEDFLMRTDDLGDPLEFAPAEPWLSQQGVKFAALIQIAIENLVPLQHRIEEGEPTG